MANKTYQLTEEGLSELTAELEELRSRRGEIADRIAAARDFGDLKENAEYDAARTEQTMVETRISEIEEIISNADMIVGGQNTAGLGSTVTIKRLSDKKQTTYAIVGSVEANPADGKISDESPMGSALLGKKPGDVVKVTTPKGEVEYELVSLN